MLMFNKVKKEGINMEATIALVNGIIVTMNAEEEHQAVAIKNDRIIGLGSNEEIMKLTNMMTSIIDLEGKTVLPGFIDTHAHIIGYGFAFESVDLFGVQSQKALIERCKHFIASKKIPEGTWVLGRGFNQNEFTDDSDFPTTEVLNLISKEHPILLLRTCGHIGVTNELALESASVTKKTFVRGGTFDKYENGEVNGVIREASLEWFKKQIAKFRTVDDLKRAIKVGGRELLKYGITSIHTEDSYDLGYSGDLSDVHEAYRQLIASNELPLRIYQKVSLPRKPDLLEFLEQPLRTGDGNDYFRMGPMKLWADGTLGARTAALLESYSDEKNQMGILVYEDDEITDMIKVAQENDMQVCIHTIGDAALEQVIKGYELVDVSKSKYRHRIVHCQIGNYDQYERIGKLNLSINIQPIQTATDYPLIEERLGVERASTCHAWKTCIDYGVNVTASSDVPCSYSLDSANIFRSIAPIINREKWLVKESVSVIEALKMYTINAAISAHEDEVKGTISIGKLADVIILDKSPFNQPIEILKDIQVVTTILGGKIMYTK